MGDFWVIVNLLDTGKPLTYILRPREVRAVAQRAEKDSRVSYWLQPKMYAVDEFEEKWQRIGPACPPGAARTLGSTRSATRS